VVKCDIREKKKKKGGFSLKLEGNLSLSFYHMFRL